MDTKKISLFLIAVLALVGASLKTTSAGTNLIANPSLETGTTAPDNWMTDKWGTNNAAFAYPVAGQDGARGAEVTITSYSSGDAKWYPEEVPVTVGKQYTFSDWSKSNTVSSIDIQYHKSNGSFTYVWLGDVAGTNSWTKFQQTFTVPSGVVALTVFHSLACAGMLAVDNYSLDDGSVTPNTPTLTFSAAQTSISYNTSTTLSWSSTNADSCTASGDWSGTKTTSGSENTGNLTANKTYTLVCTGPGGTTPAQSVTVTVASAPSSNLISNPSLESGTILPTDWTQNAWGKNTTTFSYPAAGYNGSRAAKVTMTRYKSGDAKWLHKEVPMSSGKAYQFSAWYNSNVQTSFNAQYRMNDGTYQYVWLGDIASSGGTWKQFTQVFTAPANAAGIIVFQALQKAGSLTIDEYQLKEVSAQFSQGMVTLAFDDGFKSIYTNGIPILNAAGIKSTQFIVTGFLGDTDYMTQADVLSMAGQGHEIGAHTRTHPHLTQISTTQAHDEIFGSCDDLRAMGLDPKTFTYPYGEYNDAIIQMVKDAGYIGARSVNEGFNIPLSDRYVLMDQHVEKTTTVAQAQQWIDQAVANKQWLVMEFHEQRADGDQYSNNPAILQGIVNYIKQKSVKTVTMREGIGYMSQP